MPERKLAPNFPSKLTMDKRRREMLQRFNFRRIIPAPPPPPPPPLPLVMFFVEGEMDNFPVPLL